MLHAPLTPKAIIIVMLFGCFVLIDRGCTPVDNAASIAQERHRAAMKDLGKATYRPVQEPW
jgi:hypothetical protein